MQNVEVIKGIGRCRPPLSRSTLARPLLSASRRLRLRLCTRAASDEIVDGGGRYLEFAPLREYEGNVPVSSALFSKLSDEFPKRLEA